MDTAMGVAEVHIIAEVMHIGRAEKASLGKKLQADVAPWTDEPAAFTAEQWQGRIGVRSTGAAAYDGTPPSEMPPHCPTPLNPGILGSRWTTGNPPQLASRAPKEWDPLPLSGCLSTPSARHTSHSTYTPKDIGLPLSLCGMRLKSTHALDRVSPVPLTVYLVVGDGDAGAQHCGSIATGQHPDRTGGGIIGEDVGELHGVDGHVHAAHHLHSAKHRALRE